MFLSRRRTGLPGWPMPRSLLYTLCTKPSRYLTPTTTSSQKASRRVVRPAECSAVRSVSMCVDFPEPSRPEKLISIGTLLLIDGALFFPSIRLPGPFLHRSRAAGAGRSRWSAAAECEDRPGGDGARRNRSQLDQQRASLVLFGRGDGHSGGLGRGAARSRHLLSRGRTLRLILRLRLLGLGLRSIRRWLLVAGSTGIGRDRLQGWLRGIDGGASCRRFLRRRLP